MAKFSKEEIDALYAPFALADHSIREGHKNKAKTKIQWFVYADRVAVQQRLDQLFPGEWEFAPIAQHHEDNAVTITAELIIRSVRRGFNGGNSPNHTSEDRVDTIKGAMTDTFRRVASMWGIGLYLYNGPTIWTDAYEEKNWQQKQQRENEAKRQFADWYRQQFGGAPSSPHIVNNSTVLPTTTTTSDDDKLTTQQRNTIKNTANDFNAWCKSQQFDSVTVLKALKVSRLGEFDWLQEDALETAKTAVHAYYADNQLGRAG